MSKYVPDISSLRWVIIASQRTSRPDDYKDELNHKEEVCVFCPGNEKRTDPEVMRYGEGEKDEPGWKVRVIPNKYPITDFHEVVIHAPDPEASFESVDLPQVELILKSYRDRYNFYRKKGTVLIFCNHGEHAGASIKHGHSQIVVIPFQITMDTLAREPLNNIVTEKKYFHVYCPDFSQWPYEIWIAPKKHDTVFGDITDEEVSEMAELLQTMILRVRKIYETKGVTTLPFAYNFYIYPKENWYLRIIPRFVHKAGFELGTGLSVNIIDPATAAAHLKEDEQISSVLSKLNNYSK